MSRLMKNSGIQWIGDIPQDWKIIRNKNVFYYNKKIVGKKSSITQLLSLTTKGITTKDINNLNGKLPETFDTYQYVKKNNIVMCLFDLDCSAVFSGISFYNGMISPAYKVLTCRKNVFPNYISYWFDYIADGRKFNHYAKNIRYTLDYEEFSCLPIVLPPIEEQQRIANYLDKKCSEIDSLRADIEKEITILEDYKQSLITETVTKGLNKNVPLKNSGIDWIGNIPTHWDCLKAKNIFIQRSQKGNNIELQLLSPTQKYGVIPQNIYEELSGMKAVKLDIKTDLKTLKTIHKGDYCISLRSFQGGFEYSLYEGVVSPAYQVFYPKLRIDRVYFKYLFKEKTFIDKINSYTLSLRDGKNISFSNFGETYLYFPPIEEQEEIAKYLDEKCIAIDDTITQYEKLIDKLTEYKKSLIYECVTGKKEV
ncbi:MAG: restriction endonuclease subunit S [Oscillospiraceae bacterium]